MEGVRPEMCRRLVMRMSSDIAESANVRGGR